MSLLKQKRAKSASLAAHNTKSQKARRYEKVQTQSSQSFKPQKANRIITYSRESLKKAKINSGNMVNSKEPEQMIEQNLNLKMFINNLQQQLSLQRGRLQMNKRKTQKYVKQFNRQFDKQLYYSGKNPHSYMFSGIKQQYQNVKHLYQMKCIEVEKYAQSIENTSIQELIVLNEALEEENILFRQKLQELFEQQVSSNFAKKHGHVKQKHSEIQKLYYNEDSQERSKESANHQYLFQQKSDTTSTAHYKKKAQDHEKELNQLKKKINFLQKLIIQKDNNAHKAKRQVKILLSQKHEYQAQIYNLKQQIDQIERVSDNQIKQILDIQLRRFQKENDIFKRSLLEKDNQIAKLEKQIRFLSTMLSYWKPLDEMNRNDFLGKDQEDKQLFSQEMKTKKGGENIKKQSQPSERQIAFDSINPITIQNEQQISFKSNREEEAIRVATGIRSQSQQNVVKVIKERVPQSCSKKSKPTAKKCRKVQPYQIKPLGQFLRYRLIGNNYSIENMRKLFDLSENVQEEDREFRIQYITMREIKTVFQGAPFYLNQPQAILVSRYVVEDQACEFVYLDEDNQIKRTIAKSIIKAFIGDYELPNLEEVAQEWQRLKIQYLPNIQSALKIIAPKGIISEAKFVELLVGLGIELKDDFKDWMIATMVVKSQSLKELKYRSLIPE